MSVQEVDQNVVGGPAYAYDIAGVMLAVGELRWSEDDIVVGLVSDEYRPRQAEDRTLSDLGSALVSSPVRLPGRSVDHDSPGRVCLRAQGVRFPQMTGSFRYAVIWQSRSENLVAYSDLGPQSVTNVTPVVGYPDGEVCEFIMDWSGE